MLTLTRMAEADSSLLDQAVCNAVDLVSFALEGMQSQGALRCSGVGKPAQLR